MHASADNYELFLSYSKPLIEARLIIRKVYIITLDW